MLSVTNVFSSDETVIIVIILTFLGDDGPSINHTESRLFRQPTPQLTPYYSSI